MVEIDKLGEIILRIITASGFVTKGSEITWAEEDNNFIVLGNAIKALYEAINASSVGGVDDYNPAQEYSNTDPDTYVTYNNNTYRYIGASPSTGVTPGTDESIWELVSSGAFTHQQNTDTKLAEGTEYEVTAEQIKTFLENIFYYTEGAASSTDNAIVRFDGTGGKKIQNSGVIIDDSSYVTIPGKSGTNQSGDPLNLAAGVGSGNAPTPYVRMSTPDPTTSGANPQVLSVRMQVGIWLGNTNGSFSALHMGSAAPSASNYTLMHNANLLRINNTSVVAIRVANGQDSINVGANGNGLFASLAHRIPAIIRGYGEMGSYTQSTDLTQWRSYNGTTETTLAKVDKDGNATFPQAIISGLTPGSTLLSCITANTTSSIIVVQNRVTTTDDTVTTLQSVAIPTDLLVIVDVDISIIRTGGSAGSAGDKAAAKGWLVAKNVAGTVTIQDQDILAITGDQTWPITFAVSGSSVLIQGQGTVNNNLTWNVLKCEIKTGGV